MAPPIRIGTLAADEARDLVEALAVRGLIGRATEAADGWWVELHDPHEETERLVAEVTEAVQAWLVDRNRPSATISVAERWTTVEPGERIEETLRGRLPSARRRSEQRP